MNIAESTPNKDVVIAGQSFQIPEPFTTEHLSGASTLGDPTILASVMNQTFAENIRNNFASKVKAAKAAAEKAGTEIDVAALQTELDTYVAEYEFGVRRSGGGAKTFANPVEQEMYNQAREKVKEALRKKGITLKNVEKEQLEGLISGVMEKHADVLRANAEKIIAMREEIAANELSIEV
jgi:hypothetical protein